MNSEVGEAVAIFCTAWKSRPQMTLDKGDFRQSELHLKG